jgi:hypothetical protein
MNDEMFVREKPNLSMMTSFVEISANLIPISINKKRTQHSEHSTALQ